MRGIFRRVVLGDRWKEIIGTIIADDEDKNKAFLTVKQATGEFLLHMALSKQQLDNLIQMLEEMRRML